MGAILHLGNLEFRGNGQTQASFEDPEQAHTVAKVYTRTCTCVHGYVYIVYMYMYMCAWIIIHYACVCTCMQLHVQCDNKMVPPLCNI